MKRLVAALALIASAFGCGSDAPSAASPQMHSSALLVDRAHSRMFVAHPDADTISVIDLATRRIVHERLLAAQLPSRDDAGRYEPAVAPRAIALNARGDRLFASGQRSGHVYALDPANAAIVADVAVCAEPIGVLVSADDTSVFVACSQDDEVVELDARDLSLRSIAACPRKPWALAWSADAKTLYATHLLGPGISSFATTPLALNATWELADGAPAHDARGPDLPIDSDPTEPHGRVRGIYDALIRPGSAELFVVHLMLGTDTPQPTLDFQRTVFASLSILNDGQQLARLSVASNPGDGGAFGDIVAGPHALAFSDDGRFAVIADTNSEDLLIVDAEQRIEAQLVRPLPGHMPESVVWVGDRIYTAERNTTDVAAFRVAESASGIAVTPDGPAFSTLKSDPMPAPLRLGQKLFYSSNSDDLPLTQNHWVACASCHLEGRSDAVTWQFAQGPRDTPSNAGGLLDTGFLFRTADRTRVQDYWATIDIEQGGHFDVNDPGQAALLDALADYVNYAIPTPQSPTTSVDHDLDPDALADSRTRGEALFAQLHCDTCHSGAAKTDSGAGNPSLDLSGPIVTTQTPGGVLLHDVGTCVATGDSPDVAHVDIDANPREACAFDTPQLRGLADSAPYLHDGSAATLRDVLPSMLAAGTAAGESVPVLSADDQNALVEYMRSL